METDEYGTLWQSRLKDSKGNTAYARVLRELKNRGPTRSECHPCLGELFAGYVLGHDLGWTALEYDPQSRETKRADWLFVTPSGRELLVEVSAVTQSDLLFEAKSRVRFRESAVWNKLQEKKGSGQLPADGLLVVDLTEIHAWRVEELDSTCDIVLEELYGAGTECYLDCAAVLALKVVTGSASPELFTPFRAGRVYHAPSARSPIRSVEFGHLPQWSGGPSFNGNQPFFPNLK